MGGAPPRGSIASVLILLISGRFWREAAVPGCQKSGR